MIMQLDSKALVLGGGLLGVLALAGSASASSGARAAPKPTTRPRDPAVIDALAARVAADISRRKYDYSRQLLKDFQSATGLDADGIYGPLSASKLKSLIPGAPDALFRPKHPRAKSGESLLELSARVTRDLLASKHDYSRDLMRKFQRLVGLADDGIYGPQSASKLRELQPEAPGALYLPKSGVAAAKVPASARRVTTREVAKKAASTSAPMDFSQLTRAQQAEIERENLRITHARAKRAAQLAARRRGMDAGDDPIDASAPDERTDASDAASEDASSSESEPEAAMGVPVHLELARREAPQVARHLARKGRLYSRQLVRDFQRHAGIVPDGIYGPRTRDALAFFGVGSPPEALFAAPAGAYEPVETGE